MSRTDSDTLILESPQQRKALASPIRMEILGQFTTGKGMSIAEIAKRMGRAPGSLYYHVGLLEKVGLLKQMGRRPSGKRQEALYEPAASRFELPGDSADEINDVMRTLNLAFRMAERDLESALQTGGFKTEGPGRNLLATRVHCRLTRDVLAKINTHIRAVERILVREGKRRTVPKNADQYVSLTVAMLPLKGRGKE